jgi:hypothetical protein
MRLIYLISLLVLSFSAAAGPQWGEESVTEDFLVSGDHLARITQQETVELRWKDSGNLIWTYRPNPRGLDPCTGVIQDVERIAVFANRVLVLGNDQCGYGRSDLVNRKTGELVRRLPLRSYQQVYCGLRANIAAFAVCTITAGGELYSDGIRVFRTSSGQSLFKTPEVQPGELFEEFWKAIDFTMIRGTLVMAFEHADPPDRDYTQTQLVAYQINTGQERWRRHFNTTSPRTAVSAGVALAGAPAAEAYYSTLTGAQLNW